MTPDQLKGYSAWWHGSVWLHKPRSSWPNNVKLEDVVFDPTLLEEKPAVAIPVQSRPPNEIFHLRSTLFAQIRITALCRRFTHNCRNPDGRKTGYLAFEERKTTLLELVKLAQAESFAEDITNLLTTGQVQVSSRLASLHPMLVNGIIVVGGRLENALISFGRKHPMILDNAHPLTVLIATHYHRNMLHAGQQLLAASIRERFWPLRLRNLCRKVIRSSVSCFRAKPTIQEQIVGDLPAERVCPTPPFTRVGVDYCGPKAIHMEMVSEGNTHGDGFRSNNRRIYQCASSARRGLPKIIMKLLERVGSTAQAIQLTRARSICATSCCKCRHKLQIRLTLAVCGRRGLWVTPEEFYTLLTKIEACLNSRPLTPISNDPTDLEIFTLGHFLIHRPLTAVVEPSLQNLPDNTLSRWQRVQRYLQTIWKKWSTSYLSNLQNRVKWTKERKNLTKDIMVLLKEENQPPMRWPLGRIVEVHTAEDGKVRVVKVRTKDGIYTRAISKICVLPILDNNSSENQQEED
ncbi:uncharacterized protein LOC129717084 [Wyeomyia smithii]|uniref:uncharacterized protein LOC129717084 n=1 Tax=Wyeomyia smithii TaxID=174621 RepID=UPI002467C277|nr:uncharacterized protein LOC129717084 [Wyeomyia smithii]